jgi:hypothetical protein
MKTFSTDSRIPLLVPPNGDESAHPDSLSPEERAWNADDAEAAAAAIHSRFVSLPGREPVDLEAVSDLWLD